MHTRSISTCPNKLHYSPIDLQAAFQQHFHFGNSRMDWSMGEHQLGEPTCTEIHLDGINMERRYDNRA